MNREFLGKEYSTGPELVEPESIRQFALAINEKNSSYLDTGPEDQQVPPLYPVVFLRSVVNQLVDDGEEMKLDMLRVVHAEHKISWKDVLRPGDKIYTTATIINIEQIGIHEILDLQVHCMREEVTVIEMFYRLLIRGKKTTSMEKPRVVAQVPEKGKLLVNRTTVVTEDQGIRYAQASGDHNPIHTSDEIARSAGLPSAILHGLCTMALASQVLVDELLSGDPSRLKSMEVRFSNPVFMDQILTTDVYDAGIKDDGIHVVRFESRDAKDVPVLVRGVAEFTE